MPDSSPISVPDSARSRWIIAITGGTASTPSRRQTPQIHSKPMDARAVMDRFTRGWSLLEQASILPAEDALHSIPSPSIPYLCQVIYDIRYPT